MKKTFLLLAGLLLFIGNILASNPVVFNVATYNLRNANKEDSLNGNGWGQRVPHIAKLILFHDFDIFGTQEALYGQLQDLKQLLPGYEYIGVAREDGKQKGEHSAIFYRTDKFQLLDHGDFWLSENPSRPGRGWDAACTRICTWGKFKEIRSGFTFVYFNLHMDHRGVVAREESAKLILKHIAELPSDVPVMLTGDFNVDQFSPSYTLLNTSGILQDAFSKATLVYDHIGTFNGFRPDQTHKGRIDHIFLTKQFDVTRYGILRDSYSVASYSADTADQPDSNENSLRYPSDHFPVMATLSIQTDATSSK